MRLHRLTLTAFGPFAGTQTVDFDALSAGGLFLLHGATGAGKTSLLDAVCYALYGAVPGPRGESTTVLRSDHAAPGTATEVVLELTVGGRRLEITRRPEQERPKRRGAGLTRDRAVTRLRERDSPAGTWRGLTASHQEAGEEIGQLTGMNREQFCQVVLLPQGDFARFLRASAQDRAALLGRLFDTRRFAVAETHLAGLRGAATQRLRGRAEELAALAHRIRQAAGLPGPSPAGPGSPSPGTAEEDVLVLAAQARSQARERLTIASLALQAAETGHARAQRAAEAAGELARLQRHHAEARARADALAASAAEREELRARLERARAAESVAPAADLYADVQAAAGTAAAAERQARAALPAGLADAPASLLSQAERRTRQLLGELAAARRAEERAAQLAADLDRLNREAAAGTSQAAEAGQRLAVREQAAQRAQDDLAHAQAAAARAEQHAERLRAVEESLTAARRCDELAGLLAAAQEQHRQAREASLAAYGTWLALKDRRLAGIAAELAASLLPGTPCGVCGSPTHPAPASPAGDGTDDLAQAEAAAQAAYRKADADREHAAARAAGLREEHATAQARSGGIPPAEADVLAEAARADWQRARRDADREQAARTALESAQREASAAREAVHALRERAASRAARRETLLAEQAELHREVAAARGGAASVAERAAGLERDAECLAAAAEAARQAAVGTAAVKEADARLADAAFRAGFATPQAAAEARLDPAARREAQRRLDAWQAEEAAVAAALADAAAVAAAARPPAAVAAAREAVAAAAAQLRAALSAESAARARGDELDSLSGRVAELARELAPLRADDARLSRLAAVVAGTAQENAFRMRLETYVLAARLEQVAAAATTRLRRMSAGRYSLVHSDALAASRARSGLGLRVIDAWTGRERETVTLSGGESFMVSLALSLGLADVVACEAGGQRLQTLFIDEGFGSLDEQSLDEVLEVLDALREGDRSVGIVSHVPDLRARIPVQLEVRKTRQGSTLRPHTAPALL